MKISFIQKLNFLRVVNIFFVIDFGVYLFLKFILYFHQIKFIDTTIFIPLTQSVLNIDL